MRDLEDGALWRRCGLFMIEANCPFLRGACSGLSEARRNSIHFRRAEAQSGKCVGCAAVNFPYLGTELILRFHTSKRQRANKCLQLAVPYV
jgi:hypothetical protein